MSRLRAAQIFPGLTLLSTQHSVLVISVLPCAEPCSTAPCAGIPVRHRSPGRLRAECDRKGCLAGPVRRRAAAAPVAAWGAFGAAWLCGGRESARRLSALGAVTARRPRVPRPVVPV